MRKRILVVDDDAMNLRMANHILKQQGTYEIIQADSGMEALIILKKQKVDLVLLDIEMPIMNGMKTLEIIRDNRIFNALPVMFLTASADEDMVIEAGRLGAAGYVKKPFLSQDLLDRVKRVLGN